MDNRFNPLCLDNRKIMVTGASSGIGRATAVYLSRLGARLVLVARNIERLEETRQMLYGAGHQTISIDLAQAKDLSAIFQQAVGDGIKLTGLVHCAGNAQVLPLNMLTENRIMKEMDINYYAFIALVRQYAKSKFSQGGSIVGISSIASVCAEKCQTNYAASKAAMNAAVQSLAIELAEKGIRINIVLPGVILTAMASRGTEMGLDLSDITKRQVLGAGKPEDVAGTCAFLLSDMSRMSTGRKFFVDGGRFL